MTVHVVVTYLWLYVRMVQFLLDEEARMWKGVPAVFASIMKYHIRKVETDFAYFECSVSALSAGGYGISCRATLSDMVFTKYTCLLSKSISSSARVPNLQQESMYC